MEKTSYRIFVTYYRNSFLGSTSNRRMELLLKVTIKTQYMTVFHTRDFFLHPSAYSEFPSLNLAQTFISKGKRTCQTV